MKLTEAIREKADEVHSMTVEEAKRLPNMIGKIAPAMLEANGFYSYTQGGQNHLIVKA